MARVPDHVIDSLFRRMAAMYGSAYVDKWRAVPIKDMREQWAQGLAFVSSDDLRYGIARLFHHPGPPDLPTFIGLCRHEAVPLEHRPALTNGRSPMTPEGLAELARIKGIVNANPATLPNAPRADGIQWAYKLLDKATRGQANAHQVAFAEDAISRWKASHHVAADADNDAPLELPKRIASPHIYGDREPGSDDEVQP
ncbi:hypothetical protein AWB80_02862 [Caballeronia pedi]|uniref:Uncharacterized protein n=1 Tax=Caballeronia pedi TaxID=1777141 RepID=A0A158B096_9BURK|nr:hypothetical protein [Caballeronia pedi]SAK63413.1 hypothetical protein AWB80_02862 [Caballeronia pedi]